MTFDEILDQTIEMLQRRGRVSYRALRRQFDLDDDFLEDLKDELIEVHQLALDQDGKMLVWVGDAMPSASPVVPAPARLQRSVSPYPTHRITWLSAFSTPGR